MGGGGRGGGPRGRGRAREEEGVEEGRGGAEVDAGGLLGEPREQLAVVAEVQQGDEEQEWVRRCCGGYGGWWEENEHSIGTQAMSYGNKKEPVFFKLRFDAGRGFRLLMPWW